MRCVCLSESSYAKAIVGVFLSVDARSRREKKTKGREKERSLHAS